MQSELLKSLNQPQQDAVLHHSGPLLILAGAGSGKTRAITHKIAYLVDACGVDPGSILAVTFTNKAAAEMRERIISLIGPIAHHAWISTFHSMCLRILRQEADVLGYKNGFNVYDDRDQRTLIKRCMKALNISDRQVKPQSLQGKINWAKNHLVQAHNYTSEMEVASWDKTPAVYQAYQEALRQNNAMDFGDLIAQCVYLFQSNVEVLQRYHERFQYILVDEFQDTNPAQYQLMKLLHHEGCGLCVVGDDDQSIYSWRGADIQNILNFEQDFKNTHVIKLEQNYRSSQNILNAATAVVSQNAGRKAKTLWTDNAAGDLIVITHLADERREARYVVETLRALIAEHAMNYRDCAVFYRTNAQSRVFEEELRKHNIAYEVIGGMRFYDRAEIKDILAYLRLLLNTDDSVNLQRIINTPVRGIGKKTVDTLVLAAAEQQKSVWETLSMLVQEEAALTLNMRAMNSLKPFYQLITELKASIGHMSLVELVETLLDRTGYIRDLERQQSIEADARIENLGEFLSALKEFERENNNDLGTFLDKVSLISDLENLDPDKDSLPLMTLHLAKGLEFDTVFLTGMEEGTLPHQRSIDEDEMDELEEERRLCYVGMTRARKLLYLSHVQMRRSFGKEVWSEPSRFLEDLQAEYCHFQNFVVEGRKGSVSAPLVVASSRRSGFDDDAFSQDTATVQIGQQVRHPDFGQGTIRFFEGSGDYLKVTVDFRQAGRKKLIARSAPLEYL